MAFFNWSKTASSNASADATINYREGQAPSTLNDSARAAMARLREWGDDIAGAIVTAGTSTAYTVTSNQSFDTLAHLDGQVIAFSPHVTNGATVTINVDGLGAKALRSAPNVELLAGTLIEGTPYVATYNNTDGVFYLQGFYGNPYNIPLGGMLPYLGSTAPNSAFALPYGQAVSRTTYATLFTLCSTTFGAGDGSTTFNLPDLRGRVPVGLDNMGGTAASRVTTAGSGVDGTTIGSTGGKESTTLARSDLTNDNVTVTITDPGHTHADNDRPWLNGTGTGPQSGTGGGSAPGTLAILSATTGISAAFHLNGNVMQTAMKTLSPAIIVPYILRII